MTRVPHSATISNVESVLCGEREGMVVNLKGASSRYFESFSATCKITFSVRETTKY